MAGPLPLADVPPPGTVIDGKYEIKGVLGKGGMGIVFEAVHLRMHQRVALKMLHPALRDQPGALKRLEREARAAARLRGANIARVLDVDTSESGVPYLVMEFLEGTDLGDELATRKSLPVPEAVDCVLQACVAMREAHAMGIIHRDLKPSNLFLCNAPEGPVLKILDFGISKMTVDEIDGRLTAPAAAMGSPLYMSPEQIRVEEIDERTDLWSLGVILFELLTGRLPFEGNVTQVIAAIVSDPAPDVTTLCKEVPAELAKAVHKALSKHRAQRYEDAEAFARAIAPFGSAEGAQRLEAALAIPVERAAGPTSRRPVPGQLPEGDRHATTRLAVRAPELRETAESWTTAELASLWPRRRRRIALSIVAGALAGASLLVLTMRARERVSAPAAESPASQAPLPSVAEPPPELPAAETAAPAASEAPAEPEGPAAPKTGTPARPKLVRTAPASSLVKHRSASPSPISTSRGDSNPLHL